MNDSEWYDKKSSDYVRAVNEFVMSFGEDADLENDVRPDPSIPEDDPERRAIEREAIVSSISKAYPEESKSLHDDCLAALTIKREVDQKEDDNMYGDLNEYGEPINPNDYGD